MLVSGEYFDHLDPDPAVISLDVLEHGMNVPRFNNQTTRPITVLEHCLRVRRIVAALGGDALAQLRALFHDSPEALVPWGDCLRPGKTDEMREVEMHVLAAIYEGVGLSARVMLPPGGCGFVHRADAIALYFEAMLWQPGAVDWAPAIISDEMMPILVASWPDATPRMASAARGRDIMRHEIWRRLLPVIAPRPNECWRTEVERLLRKIKGPRRPRPPQRAPA